MYREGTPDFLKVTTLLHSLGVEYEVEVYADDGKLRVHLPTGNKKIEGYSGFFSEYVFTKEGKFIELVNGE